MTNENKRLLLKDLCARLPYHPNIRVFNPDGFEGYQTGEFDTSLWPHHIEPFQMDRFEIIKPYLRPMSSMTEEEKMQLKEEHSKDTRLFAEALTKAAAGDTSMRGKVIPHFAADWCNKNHFDFRGLIPMGLALEAPKDMYNIK